MPKRYPIRPLFPQDLAEAGRLCLSVGSSELGVGIMAPKMLHISLQVDRISTAVANILKQQSLSIGCEAIEHQDVIFSGEGCSSAIITGDLRHFQLLAQKLASQPWGLGMLGEELLAWAERLAQPQGQKLIWRHKTLNLNKPIVVAIINLTPDSFSDGGSYPGVENALDQAKLCEEEGAGALELGGESTRPGAQQVTIEEELARVLPVLTILRKSTVLPLIVDTRKAEVAHVVLAEGADAINDITAMHDSNMRQEVAGEGAGAILMHMQGEPGTMQQKPIYGDVMKEIGFVLEEAAEDCIQTGIDRHSIVIDPGIGFGKTLDHNLEILHRLKELTSREFPVMIGLSRKLMVGTLTGRENPQERLWGTLGGVITAAAKGARFLRVHDVRPAVEALAVFSAIDSYLPKE